LDAYARRRVYVVPPPILRRPPIPLMLVLLARSDLAELD
jgi:hypothetical protein